MMRTVVDFQQQAASIDRSRLPLSEKRKQLEALRRQALETMNPVVVTALDRYLKDFCRDVYHGEAPPSLFAGQPSTDPTRFASNGKQLAAVMFFRALQTTPAEREVKKAVPALQTSTKAPVPHEQQFAPLPGAKHPLSPRPAVDARQAARPGALRQSTLDGSTLEGRALDQGARSAARAALEAELAGVVSFDEAGAPRDLLTRVRTHPGLDDVQRARVLDTLVVVKAGFERAGAALAAKGVKGEPNGQAVNWKHTRLEVDRVLDAALAHRLSPTQTEDALLASMFSDAVKSGPNFIVHNVHGAQAALTVLAQQKPPLSSERLTDIVRVVLEHQIGPPAFMGMMTDMLLKNAGVSPSTAAAIRAKIAAPFNAAHHSADGGQLRFSADEQAALARIGVHAWTVPPKGARHEAVSRAVIEADSMVNYACPDGWAKLIELHGPNTMFDSDTLLQDAVTKTGPGAASAMTSFQDARSVVSAPGLPVYDAGRARAEAAFARTLHTLRAEFGTKAPFLDVPLQRSDPAQVALATHIRARAASLMRAEESAR